MADDTLTEKDELFGFYSDTYKDVNGFRPRFSREYYDSLTIEDLKEMVDSLIRYEQALRAHEEGERRAEDERRRAAFDAKPLTHNPFAAAFGR